MKNKETTAKHYSLLPNQEHVVHTAMKLYSNSQEWKVYNFMLIAPQGIHSVET